MGFKVGDRIKVHFANGIDNKGIVIDVNNDILRYKRDKCGNIYSAHTKQCRRLVKKEKLSEAVEDLSKIFTEGERYNQVNEKIEALEKRVEELEKNTRQKCDRCLGIWSITCSGISARCGKCFGKGYINDTD